MGAAVAPVLALAAAAGALLAMVRGPLKSGAGVASESPAAEADGC